MGPRRAQGVRGEGSCKVPGAVSSDITAMSSLPPWPGSSGSSPDDRQSNYGQQSWGESSTSRPGSPFGARLASWWSRAGSIIIDGLVLGIPYSIVVSIVRSGYNHAGTSSSTATSSVPSGLSALLFVAFVVAQGLYFTRLNGLGKCQTLGNMAAGIGVRDLHTGEPIGVRRGFTRWGIRFLLYALLVVPGLVNDLRPLWDKNHQTFADRAAGSVMVRLRCK